MENILNVCSSRENFLFYDFALLKLELRLAIILPNIVDLRSTHYSSSPGGWGKSRIKTISAQLKLKLGLSLAIDCLEVLRFKNCKTDSVMVIFDYKNITYALLMLKFH